MTRKKTLKEVKAKSATAVEKNDIIYENGSKYARAIEILKGNVGDKTLQKYAKVDYTDEDILEMYKKLGGAYYDKDGERQAYKAL